MTQDTNRAAFEAWTKGKHWDMRKCLSGEYRHSRIQAHWEAWQAAKEHDRQSTNEWRKLAHQFDSHRMQAIGHLKAIVDHLPVDMQSPIRNFLSAPPDRQARQCECQRKVKAVIESEREL